MDLRVVIALPFWLGTLLAACGPAGPGSTGTDSTAGTTSGDPSTSGATSTSTSASSTTTGDATTGDPTAATTTSGPSTVTSTTSTSSTTTGGEACACGPDEYCDWNTNQCAGRPADGTCTSRPDGCDDNYAPVCGCDGAVHSNECYAATAGVDVDALGGCAAPEGYFPCGFRFCIQPLEYCRIEISDVGDFPDGFVCVPLPQTCESPDCTCLADEPCGEICEQLPSGDLALTCPGG